MGDSIWRYDLPIRDLTTVDMPEGAAILPHVELSDRALAAVTLWARVDPNQPLRPRRIAIVGTGNRIPAGSADGPYIGTCRMDWLVWHVYEQVWSNT